MQKLSYSMPAIDEDKLPLFFRVYYFKNGFSDDEIQKLKKIADTYNEKEATFLDIKGNVYNDKTIRSSTIKILYNEDEALAFVMHKLESMALEANTALKWNFALEGFHENIQYAKYNSQQGGHFSLHHDIGPGMASCRKISISVQLSDPSEYDRGDLDLHGFGVVPKGKGDVIIFPSFLTHQVTPVTRGVRESLVAWVAGVPFK